MSFNRQCRSRRRSRTACAAGRSSPCANLPHCGRCRRPVNGSVARILPRSSRYPPFWTRKSGQAVSNAESRSRPQSVLRLTVALPRTLTATRSSTSRKHTSISGRRQRFRIVPGDLMFPNAIDSGDSTTKVPFGETAGVPSSFTVATIPAGWFRTRICIRSVSICRTRPRRDPPGSEPDCGCAAPSGGRRKHCRRSMAAKYGMDRKSGRSEPAVQVERTAFA